METIAVTRKAEGAFKETHVVIPKSNIAYVESGTNGRAGGVGSIIHLKKYPQTSGRSKTIGFRRSQEPIKVVEKPEEVNALIRATR